MSKEVKIGREVAEKEVNDWLDFRKVKPKKREENRDNIDAIIDGMIDGIITIGEDKTLHQKLDTPIGKDSEAVSVLSFKPRMKVSTVRVCTQGIKANDTLGIAGGYIAAATGVDRNTINLMEFDDFYVSQSIIIFFL